MQCDDRLMSLLLPDREGTCKCSLKIQRFLGGDDSGRKILSGFEQKHGKDIVSKECTEQAYLYRIFFAMKITLRVTRDYLLIEFASP